MRINTNARTMGGIARHMSCRRGIEAAVDCSCWYTVVPVVMPVVVSVVEPVVEPTDVGTAEVVCGKLNRLVRYPAILQYHV